MRRVIVQADKPYEVWMERGLLLRAGEALLKVLGGPCRVALITDDRVDALYGGAAEAALTRSGFSVVKTVFAHGEESKTPATWLSMVEFLAAQRLTRTDAVLALGGGVTGDMAGFAAASYLRGIRLVQMPTTLLAMVDSSVGGKTGVNLPQGKNLLGAFYQPEAVLCDPDTLSTLPAPLLRDGLAESIKMGVLGDEKLFDALADECPPERYEEVIARCVELKAELVAADEHDRGARQLLNLGHTLGHAVEKCSAYGISHGHAVAVGMAYAARLSYALSLCGEETVLAIQRALVQNGLPVSAPYSAQALTDVVLSDKKRAGDTLHFVLPRRVGLCELKPVPIAEVPRMVALAVGEAN